MVLRSREDEYAKVRFSRSQKSIMNDKWLAEVDEIRAELAAPQLRSQSCRCISQALHEGCIEHDVIYYVYLLLYVY
jgi:hypothetical protein